MSIRTDPRLVTREAAREGFERFVGDAIDYTAEEFSVTRGAKRELRSRA